MKVLMLNRYGRLGASSRVRSLQYLDSFAAAGIDVTCRALLADSYLSSSYKGAAGRWPVLKGYVQRVLDMVGRARKADVLWVEKELFPFMPFALEWLLLPRSVPLVLDYDDAIFHNYDLHPSPLVRRLLGRKIDRLMARADLVVAGNDYLAERAKAAGAKRVEIVPSVVDIALYDRTEGGLAPEDRPVIGWIGTPSTYRTYIAPRLSALLDIATKHNATLMLVGGRPDNYRHPNLDCQDWSEEREQQLLKRMSLGIMPLENSAWSRGKCGYKLIQYMASGLPVIASPVGVNSKIVRDGENGYLADTDADWIAALEKLLADPDLRKRMGEAGHKIATREYSLQHWGKQVVATVQRLSGRTT